ncbi:hypothetical protein GCM10010495_28470 [Kitasatospora herbaricolor]|nr:hypothetical protein GCM10010495_28470 [Kitasatospora herbaricolor]
MLSRRLVSSARTASSIPSGVPASGVVAWSVIGAAPGLCGRGGTRPDRWSGAGPGKSNRAARAGSHHVPWLSAMRTDRWDADHRGGARDAGPAPGRRARGRGRCRAPPQRPPADRRNRAAGGPARVPHRAPAAAVGAAGTRPAAGPAENHRPWRI